MSLASASPAPPPAARGAVRSESAAQPPADADALDPSARAGRGKAAERVARPGEQAEDAPPAPAQSFAQLLTQTPPPPPAPAPLADAPVAGAETDASSPGQLLALLDGSWSGAGPAASVPAATAAAAATGAQPATALSAAATVAATAAAQPAPDLEPAGAGAEHALPLLAAESDAPSTLAASPALEAAAIARDASAATQAAPAIEAPTAGIAGTTPLATASRPLAAPALPPLPMPAHPDAGFDEGFGTRLVWMAEQRVGHAEIRLNPEHVGPIEVRVQLDGEQVRAEFHSAHAEVRQAIEASLPRLRELLAQHGLQLGQADVGQGQAGREGADARPAAPGRGTGDVGAAASGETPPSRIPLRARGLVDAYA
jgi:flagellar hook-length control protein FliK